MTPPAAPPAPASRPRPRAWLAMVALGLTAAAYVALAGFHVAHGALNVDEGFYAAATRAVWQGELPYRDFGFTQTPLLLYANAAPLGLTRIGLFEQRILNGVWGALALLLAARLVARRAARRAGVGWAAWFVALFALCPAWLYFTHLGKTYGLVSLLVMAMTTVFLDAPPGPKKSLALSLLAILGIGCRLPAAPFFATLWLAGLFASGRPSLRATVLACGSLAVAAALFFLPFYLAAPEQSVFWTVDFHRISVPKKDWRLRWDELVALAPGVWLLTAFALGAAARRRTLPREAFVLLAAALALAANLLPRGVYEEYGVPFLPALAVAAFLLLAPALASAARWKITSLAAALLVAPLALIPAVNWSHLAAVQRQFPSFWLPANTRPYNAALAQNLRRARETVQRLLPAGQPFIGSSIILAVEADRPIPRTLRMSAFTMTYDYDGPTANRLHLATYPEFQKYLRDIDVPLLGFYRQPVFNFAWSVPSFNFQPPEVLNQWSALISRDFVVAYDDPDFALYARPFVLPFSPPP